MGNSPLQCRHQKAQIRYEVAQDMVEAADRWMGCGVHTLERWVVSGEILLPTTSDIPQTRLCKRVAKRAKANGECAGSSSSSKAAPSSDVQIHGYTVSFASDKDAADCRHIELSFLESMASMAGERQSREAWKSAATLVNGLCTKKDSFVVIVRVEVASVSFRGNQSPFRDAQAVEDNVKQMLQQADVWQFAANYGNCLVEKVFCGGILSLRFVRAGSDVAADTMPLPDETSFEVQVGSSAFHVSKLQCGGDIVFPNLQSDDKRRTLTLEFVEKQIITWCKSLGPVHKNCGHVVRMKLAPFSRVEGITVPPDLMRMDFERSEKWTLCKEALRRAEKSRRLADLRDAVDQAVTADLQDPLLDTLQQLHRGLDAAVDSIKRSSRRKDVEALRKAIAQAEEAGLPDWDRAMSDEAVQLLALLEEGTHRARLQATLSPAYKIGDLVSALLEVSEAGLARLEEFGDVQGKLLEVIDGLVKRADEDALPSNEVKICLSEVQRLPDAKKVPELAPANVAAVRLKEAVDEMEQRALAKQALLSRRDGAEETLASLLRRIEQSEPGGDTSHFDELHHTLREAEGTLDKLNTMQGDDSTSEGATLHRLYQQGKGMLEEKSKMDRIAQQIEGRLKDACLAETASPDHLEAALQDMDVKLNSGALVRGAVSATIVDAARKQLMALIRPEFQQRLEQAIAPHAAISREGEEALASARRTLQRMDAFCRPTCNRECDQAAQACAEALRAIHGEQQRHSTAEDVRSRLHVSMETGDLHALREACAAADACGLHDISDAKGRLQSLHIAERQLQAALETGDRVHLSSALEEAARHGLRTPAVDDAKQRLQSSKTNALVTAIQQRSYTALQSAIAEAERRSSEERAEIEDVLNRARAEFRILDDVAKSVVAALGSMNYEELRSAVQDAQRFKIDTDELHRAEGILSAMEDALTKLRDAMAAEPHDIVAIQEALHAARLQGLQAHSVYREAEEVFAGTCIPPGMVWALDEQRFMWADMCLQGLAPGGESGFHPESKATSSMVANSEEVRHPFTVAVAELCHAAQISPEAESYAVQYIHHALTRIALHASPPRTSMHGAAGALLSLCGAGSPPRPGGKPPHELEEALCQALTDFSSNHIDPPPLEAEAKATINARQFNRIGIATRDAGMDSVAKLLWWLVCIVEWDTGQRIFLAFMSEQSRRTADLLNEAESTGRSIRAQLTTLQASSSGAANNGAAVSPLDEADDGTSSFTLITAEGQASAGSAPDPRVCAARAVLDEIEQVKRQAEKLQLDIGKAKASKKEEPKQPDFCRILDHLQHAKPRRLEEARAAVRLRQKESHGKAREVHAETYQQLETKLLQLQYKGRQVLDGDIRPPVVAAHAGRGAVPGALEHVSASALPLATRSPISEAPSSLQEHALLQLLGIPESMRGVNLIDRCFQKVEIYERFSEKTGAVEDEFERLCRAAVAEARQRCGGRRLIAALKPLLVDLVKRRQRISSMLNTFRNCGLDKMEKNLLRKHLQPRDLLIALTFSSMTPGPSQARMLSLASKADSPLPLLFGWAQPPSKEGGVGSFAGAGVKSSDVASSVGAGGGGCSGLQLGAQIHWGALRELFCSPSHPLVLSLGTRGTLGKSYLLQYLYALQECHFRASAKPSLRIHTMPSVDIIGDFAREEPMRGVTLADVHSYDAQQDMCDTLVATLSSTAALLLLHVSPNTDFVRGDSDIGGSEEHQGRSLQMSQEFSALLKMIAAGIASCTDDATNHQSATYTKPSVLVLFRDVDADDQGISEQRRIVACVDVIIRALGGVGTPGGPPATLAWLVAPLASLGPTELANEVKSLRKSGALPCSKSSNHKRSGCLSEQASLEDALAQAVRSPRKFPSMVVLQERYEQFSAALHHSRQNGSGQAKQACLPIEAIKPYGQLAQRIFTELEAVGSNEGLLSALFPITLCHQQLTALSQQRVRCLNRARDYLEPDERKRLESTAANLDKEIAELRQQRQQALPHPLLRTFAQLVQSGEIGRIAEFGAYLDDWKQSRRAPLLETKLRLRKELDQLMEEAQDAENKTTLGGKQADFQPGTAIGRAPSPGRVVHDARMKDIRAELAILQRKLDEIDVSTDSFWLELMLWHEMERIGARQGLREIEEKLTYSICKLSYLAWVKNGNPVHFLHSAPLQFGAFEPLRWHPQLSGASLFGSDFIGDVLRELDRDLGVDVRRRPLLVISVIGVQSSGKSTLMNYLFGCSFATHVGRCTKGLYISLLETKRELVVILDTEGLLSVEARDDVFDKQVALMTMACSDLVIVNNRGELGRHVGDLFQVCLFALYHLKLAKISPAIGFVLQCLSMVNQQQQYEWVATVKKSLEESVQELQQKEKPSSFKLQDLVFLDSESIFVMPSAFNDDVQFGLQVSRPTSLYALKALQLREKVFHWISRAKASQKQRLRDQTSIAGHAGAMGAATGAPSPTAGPPLDDSALGCDATSSLPEAAQSSFVSLSQWYEHARTVWQTLSMCGTDLLQFRTMRQVLMAQQLQEFCDALVQKQVDARFASESEALVERFRSELRGASATADVHTIDNSFRGQLDTLRDSVLQDMHHEFDEFVKAHDTKFTDDQVKSDKRFSLMGPMRRRYASVDSHWRSAVHLALEQRSMDHLFEEISERVNELLVDQGKNINVQNVERVFEEKWQMVMAETLKKQRPNLDKVIQEVVWHFNAALSNLKSQFRKSHIFHGVKHLSVHELGRDAEICSSFLLAKKGIGDALLPAMVASGARNQVDNLWIKLVDAMRLEVDQQGQMSDAAALKMLNRLNSEMEAGDQLRQLLHGLGSAFVQRLLFEISRATMHYRYQIEQQNFQSRINEVLGKKQQKLWEIQARVDSGKREVHCAKVWAKTFVDTLDQHFRNAVGRMAQEIVSHMSTILTNPARACDMAIERSFTKRNWRHVVMYAVDPTQYLFMEFHKEWEQFKSGLVDQYCQELKSSFGNCLRIAEERMQVLLASGTRDAAPEMTMNRLSEELREACGELADESLSGVLCTCLPSFPSEADWPLSNLEQFAQFASVELRRYRANTRATEISVERRMEAELVRQKANCWKCICGCPARCPGCGTKCNLESENHWPDRPHECRRHLYPAFNGWQKQDGRKPFLLHCRAKAQWRIARTRPPLEPNGRERYWDNFQAMLEDEHPDWLDPATRQPIQSMEPLEEYEEECTQAPEEIQREIEENRRAWANCKDALLEHFTSMADDTDIDWLDKYKRDGGALTPQDFTSIRDELFAVTPLESLEIMENVLPLDEEAF